MSTHTCTQHAPGSAFCYRIHACHCEPCQTAGRLYSKRQAAGLYARVPTEKVERHVRSLIECGMTELAIAKSAGVSHSTVSRILAVKHPSTRRATAVAILQVHPESSILAGLLPAIGTRRRLQGLAVLGYSSRSITAATGLPDVNLRRIRRGALAEVSARTAHLIRTAAATLEADKRRVPDLRLVNLASKGGWVPIADWDEGYGPHGIDNPDATPIVSEAQAVTADKLDEARRLLGTDTAESIARRLGYSSSKSLAKAFRRHGDDATANRIERVMEAA